MKEWEPKEWLIVIAFVIAGFVLFVAVIKSAEAATVTEPPAAVEFDHSNCQYPDRTTNPPDGCDNTDPCDPSTVKGGSGDCAPALEPPKPETPMSQNIETPQTCAEAVGK